MSNKQGQQGRADNKKQEGQGNQGFQDDTGKQLLSKDYAEYLEGFRGSIVGPKHLGEGDTERHGPERRG